jgi:high-affinity Fe2+/Pb2+ permease|tara:strand:+ start:369 stop:620 length:252 start_codon:yes stop_codon:yes gene_type:complete
MKILKGIIGAIIFVIITFVVGIFIYDNVSSFSTQKTVVIFTFVMCFGMARLGYSVGSGHINKFGAPNFIKNINLKKLLFKTKK